MQENNTNKDVATRGIDSKFLASFFEWFHEVLESADRPISLVVAVLLPFIAPLTPALITARSLHKFFPEWGNFEYWTAVLSFEFIGYLSMIAVVGALMRKTKFAERIAFESGKKNANKAELARQKVALEEADKVFRFYFSAYVIYVVMLLATNVILEIHAGTSFAKVLVILALTVGMSVSAGILNASRIYDRDESAEQEKLRKEKLDTKLEMARIRHGATRQMAADTTGVSGASDAPVEKLSAKDKSQIARFRNDLAITGNWRVDGKKMLKTDLEWLARAETYAIKMAIGGENTPDKTAQNWRNYARQKLGAK